MRPSLTVKHSLEMKHGMTTRYGQIMRNETRFEVYTQPEVELRNEDKIISQ